MSLKHTLDFIKEQIEKTHSGSIVHIKEYTNSKQKLDITCEKGHRTKTMCWSDINQGHWCFICGNDSKVKNRRIGLKHIKKEIERLHPNSRCLATQYANSRTKLSFRCENNHIFSMPWGDIKQGHWCHICGKKRATDKRKYHITYIKAQLKIIHPNYILYTKEYKNQYQKLDITCGKGHRTQTMTWTNMKQGSGCSVCSQGKTERECRRIIQAIFEGYRFPNRRPKILKGLELDIYCKDLKIAFEYNGEQHYKVLRNEHFGTKNDLIERKERDQRKIELCKENNIILIVIPYVVKFNDLGGHIIKQILREVIQ